MGGSVNSRDYAVVRPVAREPVFARNSLPTGKSVGPGSNAEKLRAEVWWADSNISSSDKFSNIPHNLIEAPSARALDFFDTLARSLAKNVVDPHRMREPRLVRMKGRPLASVPCGPSLAHNESRCQSTQSAVPTRRAPKRPARISPEEMPSQGQEQRLRSISKRFLKPTTQ